MITRGACEDTFLAVVTEIVEITIQGCVQAKLASQQ